MRPVWDLNPYLEDNQFNIMLITEPIGIEPIRNGLQPNALPYELRFQNKNLVAVLCLMLYQLSYDSIEPVGVEPTTLWFDKNCCMSLTIYKSNDSLKLKNRFGISVSVLNKVCCMSLCKSYKLGTSSFSVSAK